MAAGRKDEFVFETAGASDDGRQVAQKEEVELIGGNRFIEGGTRAAKEGPLDLHILVGCEFLLDEVAGTGVGCGIPLRILPVVETDAGITEADGDLLGPSRGGDKGGDCRDDKTFHGVSLSPRS